MWLYLKNGKRNMPTTWSDFIEKAKKIVPPGLWGEVIKGYSQSKPTTFRVNTLKRSASEVVRLLSKSDLVCEEVRSFPGTYILKKGSFKKLRETAVYENGEIYLQSLSSQLPPLVLKPLPGDRVLDMAAAPGGKTTQMAAMMRGEGEIVAVEPESLRFEKLKYNIEKQGALMVRPLHRYGQKLTQDEVGLFDKILLDAPCSSEGTFLMNEPKSFSHWSEKFVLQCARLQKTLLTHAITLLKPEGYLLYSTCALSPEENEEVLAEVLSSESSMVLVDVGLKHSFLREPVLSWKGKKLNVRAARRVYPSSLMEGFFIALLRKKEAID